MSPVRIRDGWPDDLGATPTGDGTNFAVFSAHATRVDLCLFDGDGRERHLALPARTGDIWHGFVPEVGAGQAYGFRAHGPWAPEDGHLFNPAKLLIDPYARAIDRRLTWHPLMSAHRKGHRCSADSAPVMARGIVQAARPPIRAPRIEPHLIYEAHVKGFTKNFPGVPARLRGTYGALGHPGVIAHLKRLGVSHLELLPVAAFIDDRHVVERGLVNYWGYQPVAPFAADPRYRGAGGGLAGAIRALAADGIGVILDVVFNHTGEGDAFGPMLSFRGLDNRSYYRLGQGGVNLNDAGTGNTLNLAHPMVLRLVIDALRHWAAIGVAGFRFDLAVTLLRDGSGFLEAVGADPVLSTMVLIAEPWDLGPDGYRLGRFPAPFLEWNDRYRDDVRRFWRGDGRPADLARRIAGSAEVFDRPGRPATSSVNYLASHDGFTLQDIVSFKEKHNDANREDNRDGHHDNCSDNLGAEGVTADPAILSARRRRVRAMLATLFLSQGTPMLRAGDDTGQSQSGNNNAYAQDGPVSWIDWPGADPGLGDFVARLSRLRRDHPALRQAAFLHGDTTPAGVRDLVWRGPDGAEPGPAAWEAAGTWPLGCELGPWGELGEGPLFLVFNAGPEADMLLPAGNWLLLLDSGNPDAPQGRHRGLVRIGAQSVLVFMASGVAGAAE